MLDIQHFGTQSQVTDDTLHAIRTSFAGDGAELSLACLSKTDGQRIDAQASVHCGQEIEMASNILVRILDRLSIAEKQIMHLPLNSSRRCIFALGKNGLVR